MGLSFEDWRPMGVMDIARAAWQAGYEAGRNAPLVKTYAGGVPSYCTPEQEPVAWVKCNDESDVTFQKPVSETWYIPLYTHPAPSQEPVGYVTDSGRSALLLAGVELDDDTPLYATPPDAAAQIAELKALNARMLVEYEQRMGQITEQRRVMQLALDALEQITRSRTGPFPDGHRAVAELRGALNCGCSGDCRQGRDCDCGKEFK
jgi:hypothetical protein